MGDHRFRRVPDATVARLPIYLRILTELAAAGAPSVSSDELAERAGVNAAKVRKDLSYLGTYGTRGVGYELQHLIHQVQIELGLNQEWALVIVGAGNLGQALAGYRGFDERGYSVVAMVDNDPERIGRTIGSLTIRPVGDLAAIVAEHSVSIGVIATPAAAAAEVADLLVEAGVTSILNFAPMVLNVPSHVSVRKVDLASELQILSYHEQRRRLGDTRPAGRPGAPVDHRHERVG